MQDSQSCRGPAAQAGRRRRNPLKRKHISFRDKSGPASSSRRGRDSGKPRRIRGIPERRLREVSFDEVFNAPDTADEETEYDVVRTKAVILKPQTVDEAILQMNMLGHEFYMFRNAESEEINVVYKRSDGGYSILEPDEAG